MELLALLDQFEDIIVAFITHQIFLAPIVLLIIEESGFPFPAADFVIAYTGYQVSLGHISYFLAFLILLVSDLFGASILYLICKKYGAKFIFHIGKYIDLDEKKLAVVEEKFRKYGILVIIFGRHIPGFRIPITIFSGLSEMRYWTFLLGTFLSIVWWIPFYLSVGIHLGPKTVQLMHNNHWYFLLFFLPIILAVVPFLFLRRTKKKSLTPSRKNSG